MIATDPDKGCYFPHYGGIGGEVYTMMITRFAWYEHMWHRVHGPLGYVALLTPDAPFAEAPPPRLSEVEASNEVSPPATGEGPTSV